MEISKEEFKIIDLFRKNIFSEFTLRQVMKKLCKKSYNWTYKAIDKLSKDVLISTKKGNTIVSKLNMNSPMTITYLAYLDRIEANRKNIPFINEIIESCTKVTPYFILIVAGSYATGNKRKGSDIDLVIITDDKTKEMMPYVKEITRLSGIDFDIHLLTRGEFYQMLISDDENFGKEVFRKHLIFYGAEPYYQIIKEAVKNGLPGKI